LPFTDDVKLEGVFGAKSAAGPACSAARTPGVQELAEKIPARPAVRHSQETTFVVVPFPMFDSEDAGVPGLPDAFPHRAFL
jgi:hypothetical protein